MPVTLPELLLIYCFPLLYKVDDSTDALETNTVIVQAGQPLSSAVATGIVLGYLSIFFLHSFIAFMSALRHFGCDRRILIHFVRYIKLFIWEVFLLGSMILCFTNIFRNVLSAVSSTWEFSSSSCYVKVFRSGYAVLELHILYVYWNLRGKHWQYMEHSKYQGKLGLMW